MEREKSLEVVHGPTRQRMFIGGDNWSGVVFSYVVLGVKDPYNTTRPFVY